MARRPRSSRAWHFVLSAARRDADARAVALAGSTNWGYDSDGQHSDSDSDPEYASLPSSIPSAVPVTGESFCDCDSQSEAFCGSLHAAHRGRDCRCGEEDEYFDWVWDDLNKSSATLLSCDNRKVNFHMEYSCGTAAIRGTKELGEGQHFWEIKMTSPVYGTDMMVGIGTSDVDLDKYHHTFCSLLGRDEDSWGLSYTGVAATKLQNKRFYPMVCSTAAKSSMKVIRSCASITSLQYLCCYRLRQLRPDSGDTLEGLPLPPGLKQVLHHKLGWVLSMSCGHRKPPTPSPMANPSSPETRRCQRKRCRRT
ncbi:SPRY domain-containing SOCS box protein 3 isoform X2 [Sagmatias obliquidens]|uniref:SPRY domain-containing SOCS box protein 3 isoform X2 n=1 Tax=Tursiops truncatus TaxID=9739 RepID=A0A6J3Q0Z3_TURTR|nr:SPRY domain-containing SOCS box protein 3 isoform X2 [Lagenorhynchus obliquidens]XP_033695962.1 SPRY domain-containing SOCS box protein 3 isoform X2 [Tursiops truncatus]